MLPSPPVGIKKPADLSCKPITVQEQVVNDHAREDQPARNMEWGYEAEQGQENMEREQVDQPAQATYGTGKQHGPEQPPLAVQRGGVGLWLVQDYGFDPASMPDQVDGTAIQQEHPSRTMDPIRAAKKGQDRRCQ
jgi:hypothetical protein